MGEQFLDLFAAGGYALAGRLMLGLGGNSMAWLFYLLASAGLLYSIAQSALGGRPDLWLRHLVAVGMASLLISAPMQVDLPALTYAAPGRVESIFGSRTGAAPHLTYAVERLGAALAAQVRDMMGARPALAVPGVVAQVSDLVTDPALLDDPQLRANLDLWRRRIVPQLLLDDPALEARLRAANLMQLLMQPTVGDARFVDASTVARVQRLQTELASTSANLAALVNLEDASLRRITDVAGADPWQVADADASTVSIRFSRALAGSDPTDGGSAAQGAYAEALQRGTKLATDMIALLPDADQARDVGSFGDLYGRLAGATLAVAGSGYLGASNRLAVLGSLCQRAGDDACRAAQAPLPQTAGYLKVPERDAYNAPTATTWIKESIATGLLAVASALTGSLASLVVAVLPFMLGIAKAIAIVLSVIGVWMLLWPGRMMTALAWIIGPIAFVSLWSILFGIWAGVEGFLSSLASVVGSSDHGSWSAGRIMSIALSLGYLGLPTLALHILFGTAHAALAHGGRQLETAMQLGIRHTPAILTTGRRWLWRSPLAQRINRKIYSKVGLGVLAARRRTAVKTRPPRATPAAAARGAAETSPGGPAAATPAATPPSSAGGEVAAPPARRAPRARKTAAPPAAPTAGDGSAAPPAGTADAAAPPKRRTTRKPAADGSSSDAPERRSKKDDPPA